MKMPALALLVLQLLSAEVVGDNLGKLYLYTKTGDQLTLVGNHSSLLLIGIVGAGMQGVGCFVIFEDENFEKPLGKVGWTGGQEFEEEIVVRSVKFLQEDCADVSINGVFTTTVIFICVGVGVVALVFYFNKYREARRVRPPKIA